MLCYSSIVWSERKKTLLICILLLIQSKREEKLLVMCFSESLYTSNNICMGSKYLKKNPSKMNRNVIQSTTSTSSSCNDMGKAWIPTFHSELWDVVDLEELQK